MPGRDRTIQPTSPADDDERRADVAVIGGGLAGHVAAVTAARAGARVVLVEARREPGGRARTDEVDGHLVNHGAHALYTHGPGARILREMGVTWTGRAPRQSGLAWSSEGERVPARRVGAIGGRHGAIALKRVVMPGRRRGDAEGRSMADWLDRNVPDAGRDVAEMAVRTATYAADLAALDAGAALRQLDLGRRGVAYLDGGWRTLIGSLGVQADAAEVVRLTGRVERIVVGDGDHEVVVRDGPTLRAGAVVVATGGADNASRLLPESARLRRWAAEARPVLAACLDLALEAGLGHRGPLYGLGEPTYLVDHSRSAALAPDGGRVLHGLVYEPAMRPDIDPRAHLEAMADRVAPGWRDRTVRATFRQQMVVAHDRPRPDLHPTEGPQVEVGDVPRVMVAGDWITRSGMLADAAITSAAAAGRQAAVRAQVEPGARVA